MDLIELEKWTESEDGSKWLEGKKQPLILKRDELLTALSNANGKVAELDQRSTAAENNLSQAEAALSKILIDDELNRLLKETGVFDQFIDQTAKGLKERYALAVKADGINRQAVGKNEDQELSLAALIDHWKNLPEAKEITACRNTGGGATGSTTIHRTSSPHNLSNQEIARLSETEFRQWQQELLKQG